MKRKEVYRDNDNLKRAGVVIPFTKDQLKEYRRCAKDPIYFIKKYVKIVTLDGGVMPFDLWPFQEKLIQLLNTERFVIAKVLRQVGKTATVLGYIIWLTMFTDSQRILVAANKEQVAEDILAKYKLAYEHIPFWMQQGVVEWNKGNVEIENGSIIRASSTTSSAARSGSYNIILLDEFAHVDSGIADDFYASVYPTISSGKDSKIFIISTPKGMNLFYKFWVGAVNKKNKFIPFEVHWNDVPGRDQAWYDETLKNMPEAAFRQEFLTEFLGSTNTLISGLKLQQLADADPIEIRGPLDNAVRVYDKPIQEEIDDDTGDLLTPQHSYTIMVDTSEGKKQDYHAFSVIDVTQIPYTQVATYRSNILPVMLYPAIICDTARYFNNAMVLIEIMSTGQQIADILLQDMEYENIFRVSTGNKKQQQISAGFLRTAQMGVKTTQQLKRIGCMNLKTLVETNQLLIQDFDTIHELTTFTLNTKGPIPQNGPEDYDDLAMTLVLFGWLTTQKYFKEMVTHNLRKQLQREMLSFEDFEEENVRDGPVGFLMDNGLEDKLIKIGDTLWSEFDRTDVGYSDPYFDFFENWKKSL